MHLVAELSMSGLLTSQNTTLCCESLLRKNDVKTQPTDGKDTFQLLQNIDQTTFSRLKISCLGKMNGTVSELKCLEKVTRSTKKSRKPSYIKTSLI